MKQDVIYTFVWSTEKEPHHVAEAMFKGFAKALDLATSLEPRLNGGVPSTKGYTVFIKF
jgi:imidazoleglycerol phosphate dehydratase HisB